MSMAYWNNTAVALNRMMNLLNCDICHLVLKNPCTLGACEHFFCGVCIDSVKGEKCPVCGIPSRVCDVQTDRQLSTAVSLCQQLQSLLTDKGTTTKDDILEDSTVETTPITSVLRNSGRSNIQDIYDFVGTPSPLTQKTQTKLKKAKQVILTVADQQDKSKKHTEVDKSNKNKNGKSGKRRSKVDKSYDPMESQIDENTDGIQTTMTQFFDTPDRQPAVARRSLRRSVSEQTPTKGGTSLKRAASSNINKPSTSKKPAAKSSKRVTRNRTPIQTHDMDVETTYDEDITVSPTAARLTLNSSTNLSILNSTQSPAIMKKNKKGETPLQIAVIKNNYDQVLHLLEEGAPVNVKDNAGWTPLHEACHYGFTEIAELLLNYGAFVNIPGLDNDTPLHDAVQNYKLDCVKLLVSKRASVMTRNSNGKTALDLAQSDEMRDALSTAVDSQCPEETSGEGKLFESNQVVLLTSGLNREQQAKVQKCAAMLHGKTAEEFSYEVTHVVVAVNKNALCPRTLKYMKAILSGKWVVNLEWIELCLEYESHVCEEAFEVPGASTSPNSNAPNKGRNNLVHKMPGLFDGCHFYLPGPYNYPHPERGELIELIQSGGGYVLTREPRAQTINDLPLKVPYHVKSDSPLKTCSNFIITDTTPSKGCSILAKGRMCKAPVSWLLDCIAQFQFIDLPRN